MPRNRRTPKTRAPRERATPPPEIPPFVRCFWQEVLPRLSRSRRAASPTARHLRNATVEMLEALRALLDQTITWLREQDGAEEMKRIRVED
jgi:hypothetical protein